MTSGVCAQETTETPKTPDWLKEGRYDKAEKDATGAPSPPADSSTEPVPAPAPVPELRETVEENQEMAETELMAEEMDDEPIPFEGEIGPEAYPEEMEPQMRKPTAAETMGIRVRFRRARTKVMEDQELQALRYEADLARTDAEKRELLKEYYEILFDRILKADPMVASVVEQQRLDIERYFAFYRIVPSEPIRRQPEQPAGASEAR